MIFTADGVSMCRWGTGQEQRSCRTFVSSRRAWIFMHTEGRLMWSELVVTRGCGGAVKLCRQPFLNIQARTVRRWICGPHGISVKLALLQERWRQKTARTVCHPGVQCSAKQRYLNLFSIFKAQIAFLRHAVREQSRAQQEADVTYINMQVHQGNNATLYWSLKEERCLHWLPRRVTTPGRLHRCSSSVPRSTEPQRGGIRNTPVLLG